MKESREGLKKSQIEREKVKARKRGERRKEINKQSNKQSNKQADIERVRVRETDIHTLK